MPALLLDQARPAAAGRADQPSRPRERELAGRPLTQYPERHPDRHPRPILPRQRYWLDPRARPRPRHSPTRTITPPGCTRSRSAWSRGREDEARRRTLERKQWISSAPKARQSKSRHAERYDELLKIANAKVNTVAQITIPGGRAARPERSRFDLLTKLRRQSAHDRRSTFELPPGSAIVVIRPQRRRQNHAVP